MVRAAPIGDVIRAIRPERDLLRIFETLADNGFQGGQILELAVVREGLAQQLFAGEDEESPFAIKGEAAWIVNRNEAHERSRFFVFG